MVSIDSAIDYIAGAVNNLGIYQTQLSIREEILTQAINSNSSARSRIRDADFAKEQSEVLKLQILQQTAIASLAQANAAPQAVLGFISA
jgi:flagellin